MSAGGFERGEEGLEVAKRELLEETGYTTLVPAPGTKYNLYLQLLERDMLSTI